MPILEQEINDLHSAKSLDDLVTAISHLAKAISEQSKTILFPPLQDDYKKQILAAYNICIEEASKKSISERDPQMPLGKAINRLKTALSADLKLNVSKVILEITALPPQEEIKKPPLTPAQIQANAKAKAEAWDKSVLADLSANYILTECGAGGDCAIHAYIASIRRKARVLAPGSPEQHAEFAKLQNWGVGLRKEDSSALGEYELTDDEVAAFRQRLVDEITNVDESFRDIFLHDEVLPGRIVNRYVDFANYCNKMSTLGEYLRDQEL